MKQKNKNVKELEKKRERMEPTIGGGIIGGIIGGGAGAIVGGLSGNNKGKKKVKEIKVKILLRNYSTPALYIECLSNEQIEWDSDSIVYEQTINEARRISDKLSVVIDLIDREAKTRQMELMENQTSKVSIAEELEKFEPDFIVYNASKANPATNG